MDHRQSRGWNRLKTYVGTSGFSYPEWRGRLYPEKLPQKKMLSFYASVFSTVELNNTFYRSPSFALLDAWKRDTPDDFRFALKASRWVSLGVHRGITDRTAPFFALVSRLEQKLGPVLVQLAPVKKDVSALREFTTSLPRDRLVAFEFRHASWFSDDVYDVLRDARAAMCITEGDELDTPRVVTARFAYVRLRKRYTRKTLEAWAERIRAMNVDDVFVYFKHKGTLEGPSLAKRMKLLL